MPGSKNHGKRTAFALLLLISSASAISLPEKYEPLVRPNNNGMADVVTVSMNIISISDVDEDKQKISVDFILRTFWVDKRLSDLVEREAVFANKIPDFWTPHMSVVNSAKTPTRSDRSLILKSDGSVDYTERFSVQLNCPMSSFRYPFGHQTCQIQLNSNGYNTIHLVFIWNGMISQYIPTYNPEYTIYKIDQTSERQKTIFGEFSYINVDITLSRFPLGPIARVMLPCLVFAILSYLVTFYMCNRKSHKDDDDEEEARDNRDDQDELPQKPTKSPTESSLMPFDLAKVATNGLFLFIVVIIRQLHFSNMPKSNGITALDIWTGLMSAIILLCFLMSLQISFYKWKPVAEGELSDNKGKCANKIFAILRVSIPVVFLLIFIALLGVCLS